MEARPLHRFTGLVFVFILLWSPVRAQLGGSAGVGLIRVDRVTDYFTLGANARIEYTNDNDEVRYQLEANYLLPIAKDGAVHRYVNLNFNTHYIVAQDIAADGISFYGIGGTGLGVFLAESQDLARSVDGDVYFNLNLGLGIDYSPMEDGLSFFGEGRVGLGLPIFFPFIRPDLNTYSFHLGLRYTFGRSWTPAPPHDRAGE